MLRQRAALRTVLRDEAAWVRAWVRARVPRAVRPRTANDARWFDDEVVDAVDALWASIEARGCVTLSLEDLALLRAADVPPGVGILVDGYGQGIVHRGTGEWSFFVKANLGERTSWWDGVLGPWAYVAVIRAAAESRVDRFGDLDILADSVDDQHPDGAVLQVRARIRECRADVAYHAVQSIFAGLRAPAARAESGARREVLLAFESLTAA